MKSIACLACFASVVTLAFAESVSISEDATSELNSELRHWHRDFYGTISGCIGSERGQNR